LNAVSGTDVDLGLQRSALAELPTHLEHRYGSTVTGSTALDVGVLRIDRQDGPSWVARVFPAARPMTEVDGDAEVLQRLATAGFPAERPAVAEPVSTLAGQGVLVTEFVQGERSRGARTYAVLGALLGRLHARPGDGLRPGGAWHLVAPGGGTTSDEIDGALTLLTELQHEPLRARLAEADDCSDLPHAFVHPDFVPANAITTPDDATVVIDWTGAGRGPRLSSLGFLLWVAGATDLRLIDTVLTRYTRHVGLEPEELARLADAVALRPLVLDAWAVAAGRKSPEAAQRAMAARDTQVAAITARAREALRSPTRTAPTKSTPRVAAPPPVSHDVPVTALLSQALVAYTIELDNEFEHRMPHRTTRHGATGPKGAAPWLVSLAMWFNCMRYVTDEGVPVAELERLAGTGTNVDGMRRWAYVTVDPRSALRPTRAGKQAQDVWRPLFAEIDGRWQARFGPAVDALRAALTPLARVGLPDCLPILRPGLAGKVVERTPPGEAGPALPLVTLLSRVVLGVALEFERESKVSLAVSANVLRVVGEEPVPIRDLPGLTGVSREAVDMSVKLLTNRKNAVVEPAPDRGQQIRLTATGRAIRERTRPLLDRVEEQTGAAGLREVLGPVTGEALWQGLTPYEDGWRAATKPPTMLPQYPMVLHRGAYPDGS
jgi:Ser/Thr protein kinase RdoA (MazF antagonist)